MKGAVTCVVVSVMATLLAAAPEPASQALPMRTVDCAGLSRLPAMKLVVRSPQVLMKMGLSGRVQIDFAKEMAIFISLGPAKQNLEAIVIKAVRRSGEAIVVETQQFGFEEILAADPTQQLSAWQMVVVPASPAKVEGFAEDIEPCDGLSVSSSLAAVSSEVSFTGFKERGEARKWTVSRQGGDDVGLIHLDGLQSAAWDVGPDDDPKSIRIRFMGVKSGGGAQCRFECSEMRYLPLPKERQKRLTPAQRSALRCPADLKRLQEGIMAAYDVPIVIGENAAQQVVAGYGRHVGADEGLNDIPAIRTPDLNAAGFRKYIRSDGKTFAAAEGSFLEAVDEVGQRGSLRWMKRSFAATRDVDGVGRVTVGCNELKLARIRIENVKTTDVEKLREEARTHFRHLGIRLTDEAVAALEFTFSVRQ